MRQLLFFLLLLPARAAAQDDCCCCDFRQKGQTEYDAGHYQAAKEKWQRGLRCPDAAKCTELAGLIKKASDRLAKPAPPKKTAAKPSAAQPATDAADDQLWDLLKDSQDPRTVQKYLTKYPNGRHATAARQRIQALTPDVPPTKPAPAKTTSDDPANAPAGFAYVKGGTFQMGDTYGEGADDEKPMHSVSVSSFYLGKTEVTFDEFDAFCSATGRDKPDDSGWGRGQRPVINVDWYDAVEYCNWRSGQNRLTPVYSIDKNTQDPNNQNTDDTKKWLVRADWSANGYRLPTEAEWEYAAREGGRKVRFGNGKDLADPSQMNFDARKDYKQAYSVVGEYRQQTVPAGSLDTPNALGLHDMAGNVWEWCHDWYDAAYYGQSDGAMNPSGAGSGQYRCVRGGSWYNDPDDCRAADRSSLDPYDRFSNIGFRVVRH